MNDSSIGIRRLAKGVFCLGYLMLLAISGFRPMSRAWAQEPCATCPDAIPVQVIVCPPTQPTGVNSGLAAPCIRGIDSARGGGEQSWQDAAWVDFQPLQHGEYLGPVRLPAMLEYRVRINDLLTFTFIINRQKTDHEYRLMVGDEININSISDDTLRRDRIPIQPDGTIVVPYIGPFPAADKTVVQLRKDLEIALKRYIRSPAINVEPIKVNTALEDLRQAVNPQVGLGGQSLDILVHPDGQVQLPRVGNVYVLGMTMEEIKREVNLRYQEKVAGIEVEPRLARLAPHNIFVYGEVNRPGRFELNAPTSVTAGIAMAEGLRIGANNRQVVIFRRAEDWRLVSTILDLRGGQLGKRPNPSDEIWLRDGDIIIVPPRPIRLFNNATQQIFTDGIYRIIPLQGINLNR
jgi:polysaccharide export outer membrane protein